MNYLLSFCLLVLLPAIGYCQTLSGRVTDESGAALPYVNVSLLRADSAFVAGTVSREGGEFSLALPEGEALHPSQLLRFSCVGYEDNWISAGKAAQPMAVAMRPSAVMLDETVVTAKRPTHTLVGGGIQTLVTGTVLGRLGNANDVLARLPGVYGRDGDFTVFGKGTPEIYLNGRKVHDKSILERIDSEDIVKVEVITNPGAQYDYQVKSVIRIMTRRKAGDGWGVHARSYYEQGHREGFNGQLGLSYRSDRLDMSATMGYSSSYRMQDYRSEATYFTSMKQNTYGNICSHFQKWLGSVRLNYEINADHSVGLTYTLDKEPNDARSSSHDEVVREGADKEITDYRNESDFPTDLTHKVSAYYNGKAGKVEMALDAYFQQGGSRKSQVQTIADAGASPEYLHTFNRVRNTFGAAKLVMSRPVGSGQVEWGGEFTYTHRKDRFGNDEGLLHSTDSEINESNAALFAGFSARFGKAWRAGAEARYQYTHSAYYEKGVKSPDQSRNYGKFMPNAWLGYAGKAVQAQLNYGIKVRRPPYYSLSGNVQYNDRYNYEGGNPLLRPTLCHNVGLQMVYSILTLSVGYEHRVDDILNVDRPYGDEAVLFTFDNFDHTGQLSAMLSASTRVGCWQPSYSVGVSKQYIDHKELGIAEALETPVFSFRLYNSFELPGGIDLGLYYDISTSGHSGTALSRRCSCFDVMVGKSFCKDRLRIQLYGSDLFRTNREDWRYYGALHQVDMDNYADSQKVRLTVTYRLNVPRSKYKGKGAGEEERSRL